MTFHTPGNKNSLICVNILWIIFIIGGGRVMAQMMVREPVVAGMFYPGDRDTLVRMIESYLARVNVQVESGQRIRGIVSPHAGYVYSGPVAAYGYEALRGKKYDVFVIISPSHYEAFHGASVYPGSSYKTPLGEILIDHQLAEEIVHHSQYVRLDERGHRPIRLGTGEHALEVQLPFLQIVQPKPFHIIPIVMGSQDWEVIEDLGKALGKTLGGIDYCIIASSDLSHYYDYHTAYQLDQKIIHVLETYDVQEFYNLVREGKAEACGAGPVMAMMLAVQMAESTKPKVKILKYATSGDVPAGEKDRVVGYLSAIITIPEQETKNIQDKQSEQVEFGKEETEIMFRIARDAIASELKGEPFHYPEKIPKILQEKRGVFVTLTIHHRLRGCIGYITGVEPLYKAIKEMAIAAAFRDPRFPPLSEEEWDQVKIEISVLSPMKKVTDPNEIQIGKHGLYIKKGWHSGLLLPQVALEYGWDREIFLRETCRKAGLPSDAYQDPDTEIYLFSAQIFEEEKASSYR